MEITKNEFKKLAKNATRITRKDLSERDITSTEMMSNLKTCRLWFASQDDTHLYAMTPNCRFTVYL